MAAAVLAARLSRQTYHDSGSALLVAGRTDHGIALQADGGVAGVCAWHALLEDFEGGVDFIGCRCALGQADAGGHVPCPDADERDGQLLDMNAGSDGTSGVQFQAVDPALEGEGQVFAIGGDLAEVAVGIDQWGLLPDSQRAFFGKVDGDDGGAGLGIVDALDGEGFVTVVVGGGEADGAWLVAFLFDVRWW